MKGLSFAACFFAASIAQSQPAFDVASVKPTTERIFSGLQTNPNRLAVRGGTLAYLIQQAYGLLPLQIQKGPDWLSSARFDIEAKADGSYSRDELLQRLQSLLADRFKLSVHRETKELPVTLLTVGKNGTKFQPSGGHAAGEDREPIREQVTRDGISRLVITGRGVTLPSLANQLSNRLNQIMVDKTSLSGEFDFTAEVILDPQELRAPGVSERDAVTIIYTSFLQKLGLKLESQKAPVEVLVIDHAEKPDAN